METYQARISTESGELLLSLDIILTKTDGPDEIQQKLAIVQDQKDIIRAKIEQLNQQILDTQKKLDLRRNMLELLRDIRRGEEDEVADREATLEIMSAKQQN